MATKKPRKRRLKSTDTAPPSVRPVEASDLERAPTVPPPMLAAPTRTQEPSAAPSHDALCGAVLAELRSAGQMNDRDMRAVVDAVADRLQLDPIEPGEISTGTLIDLRHEQDYRYPHGKLKTKTRGTLPVMRNPADVDTLALHQTACVFGVSQHAVRLANGDVELARARRALDVACHALAFRRGYFVAAHPVLAYVNGGGRLNPFSVHLEIEGRFPGLLDDPNTLPREDLRTTWGGDATEFTDEGVASACASVDWLVEQCAREGATLTKVAPHRIASDNRRSDPGQEIWERIGIGYAHDVHGLEPQRESRWRQGRPVPVQWDPEGFGDY